jgi:MFS family permease
MDREGRPRQSWLMFIVRPLARRASSRARRLLLGLSVGAASAGIASAVGPDALVVGRARVHDALWIGVAAAITCQLVLASIALWAPEPWRTTRRG